MRALCKEPRLSLLLCDKTKRETFRKRIERARKFFLLQETFGMAVLHIVPEVCVTKVDRLPWKELERIEENTQYENLREAMKRSMNVSALLCGLSRAHELVETIGCRGDAIVD